MKCKKIIFAVMLVTLASLCFGEDKVSTLDLIGKWEMVKRASPGYEETENGQVDKMFYNDEKIMVSMMEDMYKNDYTPFISSFSEIEYLVINQGGEGETQREVLINGSRAVMDHDKRTWKNSLDINVHGFNWTYTGSILTISHCNESISHKVSWIVEDSVKYLFIENLGIYKSKE